MIEVKDLTKIYHLGCLDLPAGGQQQHVAIARSLIIKPDLILADDPTIAAQMQRTIRLRDGLIEDGVPL